VGDKVEWFIHFTARDSEDHSQPQWEVASDPMELLIMDAGDAHGYG
jgi:hypothetical protein